MEIKIMHLYPDLLNLYGDKGNIECMKRRLLWRGIDVTVLPYTGDEVLDLSDTDIVFLGGGTDREEKAVLSMLGENREVLADYVNSGKTLFAVCGGFLMLGREYTLSSETVSGLGILDISAVQGKDGLIGDVVINSEITDSVIVGFENHSARIDIATHSPLGIIKYGNGNNGEDKTEGVIYKNVVGTSLHGPVLPKNPKLCDYILQSALKNKYPEFEGLCELDDELEIKANEYIVKRYE